jgi:hypothetical protein
LNTRTVTIIVNPSKRKQGQPTFFVEWFCLFREAWQVMRYSFGTLAWHRKYWTRKERIVRMAKAKI